MPTALIAEDEPLLAHALRAELGQVWPELDVLATVGDGASAVDQSLKLLPDVLFFDIRMPGQGGLEAAAELADEWPQDRRFPALVFVTAYDQYAVQAFETQAIDYVLKPVQRARLQKTAAKVKDALAQREKQFDKDGADLEATMAQLRGLLGAGSASTRQHSLKVIQASVGNAIRMVPVDEVLYFEAADKYVRVLTQDHEYLIRTPLRELLPQLDAQEFWQTHRGTVVRSSAIESVTRDEAGKMHLTMRGRKEKLPVSRLYAHLFKAM
ncbi:MAG TPA: LytTR family DNA-binding domain-containing protein [Ramlibacter sp.]|uniref:LytR/AlgR family response regulator transcription factor n=1 Tax=Ramlibacter sp. TaxID=1917967 RepID=UPI002BB28E70|nr:LytTR family DNA-binding domain-containing protein [Ramlibacter sp.]HVZ46358.1 LytTR family DNA-binding domain-containing protein [Ramlibacter sp.]